MHGISARVATRDPAAGARRGRPSPEPEPIGVSGYPFCGDTPQRPWKRNGAVDALYPARLRRAPEGAAFYDNGPARTLNPAAQGKCRRAKPTSPGFPPAMAIGACPPLFRVRVLWLGELAGRSGDLGMSRLLRTALARRRCWFGPEETGWAALPSRRGAARRNPAKRPGPPLRFGLQRLPFMAVTKPILVRLSAWAPLWSLLAAHPVSPGPVRGFGWFGRWRWRVGIENSGLAARAERRRGAPRGRTNRPALRFTTK